MKIIKRDGTIVDYNPEKIRVAIQKANAEVSKKYKVSNMKLYEDMIEIRLISHDKPTDSAIPVKTTLEDLFLYYFGEKVSE